MSTNTRVHALFAYVLLGIGLDFCVREYLLPWCRGLLTVSDGPSDEAKKQHEPTQHSKKPSRCTDSARSQQIISQRPWLRESCRRTITEDEIASAVVLAPNKVLKIGADAVLKFGPRVNLTEADSMLFIREHTTIPVPKILNAYSQDGKNFIVMEFVEGNLLKYAWKNLTAKDRSVIAKELKDYICQMRQIPPPEGVLIGSVTGGSAIDRRRVGSPTGGPFRSEQEFNAWQLAQLHPETALAHREMYAAAHKHDHRIVFSHGDLAFHNVIVKDGHINAIIDWEYAGWYPEHWDYCKTISFLAATEEGYLFCKDIYEKQYHTEHFLDTWFGLQVVHGGF